MVRLCTVVFHWGTTLELGKFDKKIIDHTYKAQETPNIIV